MADIKISDMTTATGFTGNAVVPIVESGTNKKVSAATLFANIQDPVVINAASEDNDTIIKGISDPALIYVDASLNRVGFSTSTPQHTVDIDGDVSINGPLYQPNYNVQTVSGSVDLTSGTTIVDSSSSVAVQVGTGIEGQSKTILRKGSGTVTITTTGTLIGGSTVTLSTIGGSITLKYLNAAWYVQSGFNATLA